MTNEQAVIVAHRLKYLRIEKGLSLEGLKSEIKKNYDIDISIDTLVNYERTDVHHSKSFKTKGMKIEYLNCFSDFYGVSSDFILGRVDIKSPDATMQQIVTYTGLSEQSITYMHNLNNIIQSGNLPSDVTNQFYQDIRYKLISQPAYYKPGLSMFPTTSKRTELLKEHWGTSNLDEIACKMAKENAKDYIKEKTEYTFSKYKLLFTALNILLEMNNGYHILENIGFYITPPSNDWSTIESPTASYSAVATRKNWDLQCEVALSNIIRDLSKLRSSIQLDNDNNELNALKTKE